MKALTATEKRAIVLAYYSVRWYTNPVVKLRRLNIDEICEIGNSRYAGVGQPKPAASYAISENTRHCPKSAALTFFFNPKDMPRTVKTRELTYEDNVR